jgi:hypothetical protein
MPDCNKELERSKFHRLMSWIYRIMTLKPFTNYFRELADRTNPESSHRAINVTWGMGSFFLYWADHFYYHRVFTVQDYMFIAAMAGITTLAAVASKTIDNKQPEEVSDESDTTVK